MVKRCAPIALQPKPAQRGLFHARTVAKMHIPLERTRTPAERGTGWGSSPHAQQRRTALDGLWERPRPTPVQGRGAPTRPRRACSLNVSLLSRVPGRVDAKPGAASRAVFGTLLVSGFDGFRWLGTRQNCTVKTPTSKAQNRAKSLPKMIGLRDGLQTQNNSL